MFIFSSAATAFATSGATFCAGHTPRNIDLSCPTHRCDPLFSQVMRLIDHSQASVRAKCLVTLQLLFRTTASVSLLVACERKLMPTIERLARENDPYLSSCLSSLLACIADIVPAIAHSISDGLASIAAQKKPIQPGRELRHRFQSVQIYT